MLLNIIGSHACCMVLAISGVKCSRLELCLLAVLCSLLPSPKIATTTCLQRKAAQLQHIYSSYSCVRDYIDNEPWRTAVSAVPCLQNA